MEEIQQILEEGFKDLINHIKVLQNG